MAAAMAEAALQQLQRQALGQRHALAVAPAATLAAASPAAAVPTVAPASAAAPAAVAKDDKTELEEYRDNVDEKAKQAAARSSKKYASEPDAYLRDEFQKIGREKVRLAERNKFKNKPKELRKLRKRRGQPKVTDSSGSSSSSDSESSGSDSSDSSDSGSESDEGSKGRSRKRKRGGREKGKPLDFKRFRRGRARSKGRSKAEKQAKKFFGRHFEGNRARWRTTRNEAEGRRLHALRVMMAQLLTTTATREEMARAVTKTIEAMTEALETYDNEQGLDTRAKVNGLESAIVKAAEKQAEQFGKEMRKIITVPRSATAHRGYDHEYEADDWA